ncbi:hypothetical protein FB451DRAFT_1293817 [Mycena latifolia]|nr:hypothetical protein FB451DRAFT_1293817 [Mycena latifolia]
MRSTILFEIAAFLFCFRKTLAQVSNATSSCGPSYNWMFNSYQQNPCQVAARLAGVCDSGSESDVPILKPGNIYTGPTSYEANQCRCSSIFYSLLSACSICQSRQYLSWSNYSRNCSAIYSGVFIGEIPAGTAVETWAYQNVTEYDGFNASAAEKVAASDISYSTQHSTQSTSSFSISNHAASSTAISVPQAQDSSTLISAAGSVKNKDKITWAVIGTVCAMSIGVGLALAYKLWRRRKGIAPSAVYAPISMASSQHTLFTTDGSGSGGGRGRNPPSIVTPASSSLVSLPSLFYEPSEPSAYSPAVESSDMFTSQGGHSPLNERVVPLSQFVRLVPLRRPGGRS